MPSKANEIAIDSWSASQAKTRVGGTIKLATEAPTRTYRVVGLIEFSGIGTDGATFSIVTPERRVQSSIARTRSTASRSRPPLASARRSSSRT